MNKRVGNLDTRASNSRASNSRAAHTAEQSWNAMELPRLRDGYTVIRDESSHGSSVVLENGDMGPKASHEIALNDDEGAIDADVATDLLKGVPLCRHFLLISLTLLVVSLVGIWYTHVSTPEGSSLSESNPYMPVHHPDPPTSYWGNVKAPYPTGAFWTNMVVKDGQGEVGTHPYGIKCTDDGVLISYGPTRRVVTDRSIIDPFDIDLQVASWEEFSDKMVEKYDNVSVTMKYQVATAMSNDQQQPSSFKTHLVKGDPFVTIVYDRATPVVSSEHMKITDVQHKLFRASKASSSYTVSNGVQYMLTLGNFQNWLLYCSEDVAFTWLDNQLVASRPITGFLRIALLPPPNPPFTIDNVFDEMVGYAPSYAQGGSMTLTYSGANSGIINIEYDVVGNGNPILMYALPHHLSKLDASMLRSRDSTRAQSILKSMYSIKGRLTPIVGSKWTLTYNLVHIDWEYIIPEHVHANKLDDIREQLMADVQQIKPSAEDPYGFGKELGRMARLASIADCLGIPEVRSQAVDILIETLTPWLEGTNTDMLVYDQDYAGLVSSNGLRDSMADFGQGWYNDHHFHYGYFIYSMAMITKFRPETYNNYSCHMDAFVRDICNYDDHRGEAHTVKLSSTRTGTAGTAPTVFPFARHKDFFDGHSWASGLFTQANGKGQESTGEAINAYYGCSLYGMSTNKPALTNFARLLLSMEIDATKIYWQMTDDSVYDNFFASTRMVGNIGATDVTATTWFGSNLEYVHGIQWLPVTPITGFVFDQKYVQEEWPLLKYRLEPDDRGIDSLDRHNAAHTPTAAPTYKQDPQCSAYPECVEAGLVGQCCPTVTGDTLACCGQQDDISPSNNGMTDDWKSLIYAMHAVVDQDAAIKQIMTLEEFGAGNSKTNMILWTLSRPPPITYNDTAIPVRHVIDKECIKNSACDATGLHGQCCPTDDSWQGPGVFLGCCPK